jgi:hypothetical protein
MLLRCIALEPLLTTRAWGTIMIESSGRHKRALFHAVTFIALLPQRFDENGLIAPLQVKPFSAIETCFLTNAPLKSWH